METQYKPPLKKFAVDFQHQDSDIRVSFFGVYAENVNDAIYQCQLKLAFKSWDCVGADRQDHQRN